MDNAQKDKKRKREVNFNDLKPWSNKKKGEDVSFLHMINVLSN
jgi:hypothetical protein